MVKTTSPAKTSYFVRVLKKQQKADIGFWVFIRIYLYVQMKKIIIDCLPLQHQCCYPYAARFIINCHAYLLLNTEEAEWVFVMDKTYINNEWLKTIPGKNRLFKKIFPGRIGWKIWFGYQLPSLIKKYKADLLINTVGVAASASSAIAQCTWMPLIPANSKTKNETYFNFYKKRLTKTLQRSQLILTFSEKSRQQFVQQYGCNERSIMVVRGGAKEQCSILNWAEKENVKVKYAAGKEYYIVVSDSTDENLIHLLKAFSQFKKRQQSNMQLIFAGQGFRNDSRFIEKLETFKYRTDVHVYDSLSEDDFSKLISAAYGLVHPFQEDETGDMILNAFKANVPVIASDKGSLSEIAADAALYAGIHETELLAAQLMLLYKDENLRMQLIEKGKLQLQQFNWPESMERLQNVMMNREGQQS